MKKRKKKHAARQPGSQREKKVWYNDVIHQQSCASGNKSTRYAHKFICMHIACVQRDGIDWVREGERENGNCRCDRIRRTFNPCDFDFDGISLYRGSHSHSRNSSSKLYLVGMWPKHNVNKANTYGYWIYVFDALQFTRTRQCMSYVQWQHHEK